MIDITFIGHSCFKIRKKNLSIIIDPYSEESTGLKFPKTDADIVLCSHGHQDHHSLEKVEYRYLFDGPGEYEVDDVSLSGYPSFHDDQKGQLRGTNTIFEIKIENMIIVHLGDLGEIIDIPQPQVDVLMIPVGGVYTITAKQAKKIIDQVEPLIVVPMHFKTSTGGKDLEPVDNFVSEVGKDKIIRVSKLSLAKDKLPSEMQVILFE